MHRLISDVDKRGQPQVSSKAQEDPRKYTQMTVEKFQVVRLTDTVPCRCPCYANQDFDTDYCLLLRAAKATINSILSDPTRSQPPPFLAPIILVN